MKGTNVAGVLVAFLAAVVVTTVWGSIVQTQYNLAALSTMGAEITPGLRLGTTTQDIFSGFSPTYAGYVVLPSLLIAFIVAWFIAGRTGRTLTSTLFWFTLAGAVAIGLGIPIVNYLAPVALLIGATRDVGCIVVMALGGGGGGLLFGWLVSSRSSDDRDPLRLRKPPLPAAR